MSDKNNTNGKASEDETQLLKFPCDFPIKIFGHETDDFVDNILTIIQKHFASIQKDDLTCRHSKDNKYLAITVTVHAQSKAELDAVYLELNASDLVVMTL